MAAANDLAGADTQDGSPNRALVCAAMGNRVLAQSAQGRLRGGAPADEECPSTGASLSAGYDRSLAYPFNVPVGQRASGLAGGFDLYPGGVADIRGQKKRGPKTE